jgi:hypothetical protein
VSVPCPLCGTARASDDVRCPACGLAPGFGPGAARPPFDARFLWMMIAGIVAIYAVTLGVVALTN